MIADAARPVELKARGEEDKPLKDLGRCRSEHVEVSCFWDWKSEADGKSDTEFLENNAKMAVNTQFLHTNATAHSFVLGAVAELVDNAVDEGNQAHAQRATYVHVYVRPNLNRLGDHHMAPVLVVEDDGGGMLPCELQNCISLGYSMRKHAKKVGRYGNGLKSGAFRLGSTLFIITKSSKDGTITVGLSSFIANVKAGNNEPINHFIAFNSDFSPRYFGDSCEHREEWQKAHRFLGEYGPFEDVEALNTHLRQLPPHGTQVMLCDLWTCKDSKEYELDFLSDPYDVQVRTQQQVAVKAWNVDTGKERALAYKKSLRAYMAILYLELPPGFQMYLCQKLVPMIRLKDDMQFPWNKPYRPRLHKDEGEQRDPGGGGMDAAHEEKPAAEITIGFAKEAKAGGGTDLKGVCIYHKKRLIVAYEQPRSWTWSTGKGVIGVVDLNFLNPLHNKQDFETSEPRTKLSNELAKRVLEFWKLNCHRIGYKPEKDRRPSKPVGPPRTGGALLVEPPALPGPAPEARVDTAAALLEPPLRLGHLEEWMQSTTAMPSALLPSAPIAEDPVHLDKGIAAGRPGQTCARPHAEAALPLSGAGLHDEETEEREELERASPGRLRQEHADVQRYVAAKQAALQQTGPGLGEGPAESKPQVKREEAATGRTAQPTLDSRMINLKSQLSTAERKATELDAELQKERRERQHMQDQWAMERSRLQRALKASEAALSRANSELERAAQENKARARRTQEAVLKGQCHRPNVLRLGGGLVPLGVEGVRCPPANLATLTRNAETAHATQRAAKMFQQAPAVPALSRLACGAGADVLHDASTG
ncbi:hypothetical protein CYMTET_12857 [Cymbomonas tetramitiformis]|uniref:Morc S5 domain-containing protein n=1 Tax=Cymbomonas tetramitiformis TaxID=36881 RepID=A0AAE0GJ93_9CHLO|nr:hypothetical protein CYMTET_12857 [Cymbomonas tetramitiformis]